MERYAAACGVIALLVLVLGLKWAATPQKTEEDDGEKPLIMHPPEMFGVEPDPYAIVQQVDQLQQASGE